MPASFANSHALGCKPAQISPCCPSTLLQYLVFNQVSIQGRQLSYGGFLLFLYHILVFLLTQTSFVFFLTSWRCAHCKPSSRSVLRPLVGLYEKRSLQLFYFLLKLLLQVFIWRRLKLKVPFVMGLKLDLRSLDFDVATLFIQMLYFLLGRSAIIQARSILDVEVPLAVRLHSFPPAALVLLSLVSRVLIILGIVNHLLRVIMMRKLLVIRYIFKFLIAVRSY